jgi:hypothetical protein
MAIRELMLDGVAWTVWQVTPSSRSRPGLTGASEVFLDGWLVFECEVEKRRLAPVPAGWDEWSDAELARTLAGAPVVPRRR